jgi:hypothetical protein
MDALVKQALDKVNDAVKDIDGSYSAVDRERKIARAIHAVDALKSALKTL